MAQVIAQSMSRWLDFAVKTFIVVFAFYLGFSALLIPVFSLVDSGNQLLDRAIGQVEGFDIGTGDITTNNVKLRVFGLINNPEVHYKMAQLYKEQGKDEQACQAMDLAMGLVQPDVKKYQTYYDEISDY